MLAELLSIKPDLKAIIASGYTMEQEIKKTLEAGAAGFIGKPFRLTEMLTRIREILGNIDISWLRRRCGSIPNGYSSSFSTSPRIAWQPIQLLCWQFYSRKNAYLIFFLSKKKEAFVKLWFISRLISFGAIN